MCLLCTVNYTIKNNDLCKETGYDSRQFSQLHTTPGYLSCCKNIYVNDEKIKQCGEIKNIH
jgi:hypothetical protein